jgi:hypothetical protein
VGDALDDGEGVLDPVIQFGEEQFALRLGPLPLADVDVDADQPEEVAVRRETGPRPGAKNAILAIGVAVPPLHLDRLPVARRGGHGTRYRFGVLGMHRRAPLEPLEILADAPEFAEQRVEVQAPPVGRSSDHDRASSAIRRKRSSDSRNSSTAARRASSARGARAEADLSRDGDGDALFAVVEDVGWPL